MSRTKKRRSNLYRIVGDQLPSRRERLADDNSYESRKRKAKQEEKKKQSVYQRHLESEKPNKSDNEPEAQPRGGRLADKIRQLNQEKTEQS